MNETLKMFLEENGYECYHDTNLYSSFKRGEEGVYFSWGTPNKISYFNQGKKRFSCEYHLLPCENVVMILCGCGSADFSVFKSIPKSLTA